MDASTIYLHRETNAPSVPLVFVGASLPGSEVEIVLTPKPTGVTVRLSTMAGDIVIIDNERLILTYDEALVAALPLGLCTTWDAYQINGEVRRHLRGGMVKVLGAGESAPGGDVTVQVPGLPGPPPWVHRGAWAPGTYPAKSSTSHNGSTWLTLVETDDEPDEGTDWEVLLDGSDAAADRAAAAASAAAAGDAAGVATGAAGAAVYAAEMTAQDRVATGDDRVATGQDRAAVSTDKAAVGAYYDKIVAAPKTISAAAYTLLLDDIGRVLRFTNAGGCVLTLPAAIAAVPGWWAPLRRIGGPVTWSAEVGSVIKPDSAASAGISGQWTTVTLSVDSAGVWLIEGVLT